MTIDTNKWKERVSGWTSNLDLPADTPKGDTLGRVARPLPDELTHCLGLASEQWSQSLPSLLLAGFHVLLARYARQPDVLIIAAIDGAEPLPIRPRIDWTSSARSVMELIAGQSELVSAAVSPDSDEIRREVKTPVRTPYPFLFDGSDQSVGKEAVKRFKQKGFERFQLLLSARANADGIHVSLHFDRGAIEQAAAERFLRHLEITIGSMLSSPDQPINELAIMPDDEYRLVEEVWNSTAVDYPRNASIPEVFRQQVARDPEKLAIQADSGRLTYGQLDVASDRIAQQVLEHGTRPGDLVGISMDRGPEMIIAALGILKAGCAYVPLDPSYPDARLSFMIEDTSIRIVLVDPSVQERLEGLSANPLSLVSVSLPRLAAEEYEVHRKVDVTSGDQLAYVIYTSGSTGTPKGVRALHRGVIRLVSSPNYADLTPDDRVMAFAPISFDASTLEIWGALLNGGTVVVAPAGPLSIEDLGSFIEDAGITTLWLTAALFHELVDSRIESFAGVRQLLAGGDVLSASHARRVLEAFPDCLVINGYGPTENTTFTACHRMTSADALGSTVPIGRPISNSTTYVLGPSGELMPIGVPGELFTGGDGVADGYLNRPELTAERFVRDPFTRRTGGRLYRTGDLALWRPDGTLEFLGRADQQVKIRGYRVELGEIEAQLAKHPSIQRVVAVATEHGGEKRLAAYVVVEEATTAPSPDELRRHLREALPEYMVPSFIVFLDNLPVTSNGKIDREALPNPATARPARSARAAGQLHEVLHTVWCDLLGVSHVDPDERFFDVGGTSLLSLKLIDTLKREHDLDVPIVKLYEHPTIRSLADHLGSATSDAAPRRTVDTTAHSRGSALTGDRRIAIVGMAGRFPGASDVDELWAKLRAGQDGRVEFSEEDLRSAGVPDEVIANPEYVRATFPLDGAEDFDADFFGFRPREVELMDPQQRLFLELAWTALEHAGYNPKGVPGRVGVFGGVGRNSYLMNQLATHPELADILAEHPGLIGNERDFPTTHVSFRLGLTGPSIDVQTACSTSGVAVHLARQSLLNRESDVALAGGCKVIAPNRVGYLYEEGGALSPEARIRAFDANARGMVRGSGGAMLVLKRYEDAVRDGDGILAVVLGSAVNNDGARRVGFAAPSPEGQARVIADALRDADVSADSIDYVEAHGTGTPLGDPIEIEGLTKAYRESTDRVGFCRIGSIKTNIGHLDAGATAAGIIKTVLSLRHGEIPPSINFDEPNPHIPFQASPFTVNQSLTPWPRRNEPRRAGVSSFGLGGTNAHIIIEEAASDAPSDSPTRALQVLPISARTESALATLSSELARCLDSVDNASQFADTAHTLQVGRSRFAHRRVVVADSPDQAAAVLRNGDRTRDLTRKGPDVASVAFMFPGGGSQYPGMAAGLWKREPVFRRGIEECHEILESTVGLDLIALLFGAGQTADLERPSLALPALFAVEAALGDLWLSWGVQPAALIGHSMGEYTAAHFAGVLSRQDGLALVTERGRLFEKLPAGSMLAVPLPEHEIVDSLGESLSIAAINRPDATVVSGSDEAVADLERHLESKGIDCTRVHISVAAHSPMVDPILGEFEEFMRSVTLTPPRVPLISNVSGTWMTEDQATDPSYWVRHLRHPVRFAGGVQAVADSGATTFLEVGPGRVLGTQVRQHPGSRGVDVVASTRHPRESGDDSVFILRSFGELWAAGVDVDWALLHGPDHRRRVPVPTYPFERTTYSIPAKSWGGPATPQATAGGVPGSRQGVQQSAAHTPPTRQATPMANPVMARPRLDRIVDDLRGIVHELSGIEIEKLDPKAAFLELGFDSLFLAQANSKFKRHFKVKLNVRQLMEATPSIEALAAHLDDELAPDFYPAETVPTPPADTSLAAVGHPAPPLGAATGSQERPPMSDAMQSLIQQQLDIMRQQLVALGGGVPAAPAVPAAAQPPAEPAPSGSASSSPGHKITTTSPTTHGPWRPVDKERRGLEERQHKAIAELTAKVTQRTAKSKAFVGANRRTLADPRSVVGFRSEWKELTYPLVIDRAKGSRIWDLDGNEYVDVVGAFGVNFLGHSPDYVTEAVRKQLDAGFAIGPQVELAGEVASLVSELTGMERVTFCNTGSEAVLAALRIARTVTGNDRIASFSAHYHGIFDEVLVKAVDVGDERKNFPIAPGIPERAVESGLILDYGDPAALDSIRRHADELACVILEPVRSRNPSLQPFDFVRQLRALTRELDIPLIFDEMITGFRSHLGGAQALLGVEADIATYGKIVGGGYPIGVVAGKAEYMDALDGGHWEFGDDSVPEADMTWFAGTFVRHPVALAAARASLEYLREQGPGLQEELNRKNALWVKEMNDWFEAQGASIYFEHFSSFFLVSYKEFEPYSDLLPHYLLLHGVFSRETRPLFWSVAHTDEDWKRVADAYKASVVEMQRAGLLAGGAGLDTEPSERTERVVPLTPGQQEIWLVALRSAEASCAYNLCSTIHLQGALDTAALEAAFRQLVQRHEALRAIPSKDGKTQRILPELVAPFEVIDLADLDETARMNERRAIEHAEVSTPFDMLKGPLVRARLVRLRPDEHLLLLTAHHIIADGWSCGVLMRNLAELYGARVEGRSARLPDVMPLTEWVEECQGRAESEEGRESMEYWTDQLSDPPPPLELPSDRARPPVKTYPARRIWLTLDPDESSRIRQGSKRLGSTVFVTLLASFYAFLNRITSASDLVVGFSLAGQSRYGGRDLVSHCVDFLPIRAQVDPEAAFRDHVRNVQGRFLDAMEFQYCTFGDLVRSVNPPRDKSRTPLAQVAFNLDPSTKGIDFSGLVSSIGSVPREFENMDAFFNVVERNDDLFEVQCTFNLDLYDEERVAAWLEGLRDQVLQALEDPDRPISSLPLPPDRSHRIGRTRAPSGAED